MKKCVGGANASRSDKESKEKEYVFVHQVL